MQGFNRREFIKRAGIGAAALYVGGCGHLHGLGGPEGSRIVPGQIPALVPGRLDQQFPDAAMISRAAGMHPFDLETRMDLAVNAMTCCTDPNRGYISYSQVHFESRPPYMLHTVGDFVDDMGRHTDAIWMIRSATGTKLNDEVVRRMAQNAMDAVENGVAWNPRDEPFTWWTGDQQPKERWSHLPEATRVVLGLVSYHRATGDPRAMKVAREMVHGFHRIASKDDKYIWFPDFNYEQSGGQIIPMNVARGQASVTTPAQGAGGFGNQPAAMMGLFMIPLLRYYEETQDELAADFAHRFARLVIDFMPDFAKNVGQTHSSMTTTAGIYKAGKLLNELEYVQWAQATHDYILKTDYIMDFGWSPEQTTRERKLGHLCCETCTTTDLLEMSLLRAVNGEEAFWDVAERTAMNQLLESQYRYAEELGALPEKTMQPLPKDKEQWYSTEQVAARALGGFPSFGGPNDLIQAEAPFAVQCCFGSGARGLYDTWYDAANEDGETVRVNMGFSKRLPSAVITSYMPGRAAIKIRMTRDANLQVRKPGWAEKGETKIAVNGQPRQQVGMKGTYLDLGGLKSGSEVLVEFPNQVIERKQKIGEVGFTTKWRGNAVVSMEPKGEFVPNYRERGRADGVEPGKKVAKQAVAPI